MTRRAFRLGQLALVAAHATILGMSCEGCPSDAGTFIARDFGTLNPLFDKAGFDDFAGRVIDPRRGVHKRFRLEMVLDVEPGSIGADSVQAFVVPASIGPFSAIGAAPPYIPDLPGPPLPTIRVERMDIVRRGTAAVGLVATFDRHGFASAAGRDVVIQVDPRSWRFLAPVTDTVFQTPTRFTFRVSERGPDGDPPFLADVTGMASDPLDELLDPTLAPSDLPVVPPHAELRFLFSEPMLATAPLVFPQDPAGLQLRPKRFEGGGFTDLVTATEAGLVPGQEYCVSFVPPDMARTGPLSWGSQDLSGEPLVPAYRTAGLRRAARGLKAATDFCFRTGSSRIESPRRGELVGAAIGLPSLEFLSDPLCLPDVGCEPDAGWKVSVRLTESDDLGSGWTEIGFFLPDDPAVQITQTNGLKQGELLVPVDDVIVPLAGPLPEAIVLALCEAAGASLDECDLQFRVDTCRGACDPGDVIDVTLDFVAPPDVNPGGIDVEDTDPTDGTIDRVCSSVQSAEDDESIVVEVVVTASDGTTTTERHVYGPESLASSQEDLGGGRVRYCVYAVPVSGTESGGAVTVRVFRRDGSGNESNPRPTTLDRIDVPCRAPPRKHVAFDGRRSAMAVDRSGRVWVLAADQRELTLSHWSDPADVWVTETVDCLCGRDPNGTCLPAGCPYDWGWTVDLTIDPFDRPVACYTRAPFEVDTSIDPPPTVPQPVPGSELRQDSEVRIALRELPNTYERMLVDTLGRNLGCAVESRRNRPTGTTAELLVGYFWSIEGGSNAEAKLRYATYADGALLFGPDIGNELNRLEPGFRSGGYFLDLAVDDNDAFLAVVPSSGAADPFRAVVLREGNFALLPGAPPHPTFLGPDLDIVGAGPPPLGATEWGVIGDDDDYSRVRIAARGARDFALVMSDRQGRLLWAHQTPDDVSRALLPRPIEPDPSQLVAAYGAAAAEGERVTSNQFLNNGGVATAAGLFWGIPADIAFAGSDTRPTIAWAAATPNRLDYHTIMLGRPVVDQSRREHRLETIDGRVMFSANVRMTTGTDGAVRLLYHNGMDPAAAALEGSLIGRRQDRKGTLGSLAFFRQEDEDELGRDPERAARGAARCFHGGILRQDQIGPRGALAALDDDSIALVPRPAIDPDPCGRTVDPGWAEAIGWETRDNPAPTPDLDPEPTNLFRRAPGESLIDFSRRTNRYRLELFPRLRYWLGDLTPLNLVPFLARIDNVSWNEIPNVPADDTDELLADDDGHAGRLDPLWLGLAELLDDMSASPLMPGYLCEDSSGDAVFAPRPPFLPGTFQRNPNPYYRGLYVTDHPDDATPVLLNGTGPNGLAADRALFDEFLSTFTPGVLSDDLVERDAPSRPGLLSAALRGVELTGDGFRRPGDHQCVPLPGPVAGRDVCEGTPAIPAGPPIQVLPEDGWQSEVPGDDGALRPACPRVRPGALNRDEFTFANAAGRAPGRPRVDPIRVFDAMGTPIEEPVGCCTGFEPVPCSTNDDCARLSIDLAPTIPPPRGTDDGGTVHALCRPGPDGGVCVAPLGCPRPLPDADHPADCPARDCLTDPASCQYQYRCVPSVCNAPLPIYCEQGDPVPPASIGCSDDLTDECNQDVSTQMARWRSAACTPGSQCTEGADPWQDETSRQLAEMAPRPLLRQLFGHYFVNMIVTLLQAQNAVRIPGLPPLRVGGFGLHETVREVQVRWIGHQDGFVVLQGYLELTLRLDDPRIVIDVPLEDAVIQPALVRIRLQPYFHPSEPPLGACDGCSRRRPDMTVHWRMAAFDILEDVPGSESPPHVSEGCTIAEVVEVTNCGLGACTTVEIGDTEIGETGDILPALLREARRGAFAATVAEATDTMSYLLLSEPLIGGVALGRLEAVEALLDYPECDPGSPITPRETNLQCDGASGPTPHSQIEIADTIDALAIRPGIAEVRGRDNGRR